MQKILAQELENLCLGLAEGCLGVMKGLRATTQIEAQLDEVELTKALHLVVDAYTCLLAAASKDAQTRLLLAKYTSNCKLDVAELRNLKTPILELLWVLSDQGHALDARCSHKEPDGSSALIDETPNVPSPKRCVGCGKRL